MTRRPVGHEDEVFIKMGHWTAMDFLDLFYSEDQPQSNWRNNSRLNTRCVCCAVSAQLPTYTEVGMASLMPEAAGRCRLRREMESW